MLTHLSEIYLSPQNTEGFLYNIQKAQKNNYIFNYSILKKLCIRDHQIRI